MANMCRIQKSYRIILYVFLVVTFLSSVTSADVAWLDGDPNAIWARSPGFYKEGNNWYAIIHVKPTVTRVRLAGEFTDWESNAIDLTKTPDGKFWWLKITDESFLRAPIAGDKYRFILNEGDSDDIRRQDPAARRVEDSNLSKNSIVTMRFDYTWHDSSWSRPGWEYYLIYQLHPLRFTKRNGSVSPLRQLTEELDNDGTNDYLNDLHVTAIELLPINEFPGDYSWGYNPSFFYAVESSYGTPDQLKELVDTAHQNGIAVILDVVFNHGGNGDNILWQIAQNDISHGTYYDGDTAWGPMVNFDNDVARHFFVQNILYLAKEYHIDGFRFDATRPIHIEWDGNIKKKGSGGGWNFLKEIRARVKAADPGIILIAEELPNNWYITMENVGHQWGGDWHGPFDSQWVDTFHDNFKEVLKGAHLDHLYDVFRNFGDSWQDGLIYTESHDEVGNMDERIARRGRDAKGWEMCQISATGTILARGIPMIFMGQEGGESLQFGQDDGKLSEYNPGTGETWWDDRIPISDYETDIGRNKVRLWFKKMYDIRAGDLNRFASGDIRITHIHNDNGVLAFTRDNDKYLIVLNFKGRSWEDYDVGISGLYQELANTSWPEFNVGGYPVKSRGDWPAHNINNVHIPAYGAVVLVRWD
jgi:1,4-alpha-glucan branching enzyme